MANIQINTDLRISSICREDATQLFDLIDSNRARLREWLGWLDKTRELKDSISFIEFATEIERTNGAITAGIHFQNRLVGLVSFHPIDKATSSASVGYWVAENASGKGIVTQSVRALVDYGFNHLNLETIYIKCATGNQKSFAIPERLGFRFEKIVPNAERLYERHVDHRVYKLSKSDWQMK